MHCNRCGLKWSPPPHPAISRVDNKTKVCPDCGLDEAIQQHFAGTLIPKEEWPIPEYHPVTVSILRGERDFWRHQYFHKEKAQE